MVSPSTFPEWAPDDGIGVPKHVPPGHRLSLVHAAPAFAPPTHSGLRASPKDTATDESVQVGGLTLAQAGWSAASTKATPSAHVGIKRLDDGTKFIMSRPPQKWRSGEAATVPQ